MGPTWVLSAPDVPHVGPRNLAIRVYPHTPHSVADDVHYPGLDWPIIFAEILHLTVAFCYPFDTRSKYATGNICVRAALDIEKHVSFHINYIYIYMCVWIS